MNHLINMKKIRIPKQPKVLAKKVVEYYFKNPNENIRDIADVFNVAHTRISMILEEEFKRRMQNSIARKWMSYETKIKN